MLCYKILLKLIVVTLFPLMQCKENIAQILEDRYNDDVMMCEDDHGQKKPAYQCSGIIIRAVHEDYHVTSHAWSLETQFRMKKSLSFAFLRKDAPFSQFPNGGYDSGFIIYPPFI